MYREMLSCYPHIHGSVFTFVCCIILVTTEAECSEGEVRLQGDRGPNEGRVEICYEGVWSIVCGYKWDYNDAVVLCRELNLPTTGTDTCL